jgi:uroporphyrinogen III methyltransferase / synthase
MKKNERAGGGQSTSRAGPLRGKTVLVTRPRGQSEDIAAQLEALGAAVIHCPTIEVVPPSSWAPLDASIRKIKQYDWIVFTSANGVHFFFHRLNENGSESGAALRGCVVCAIGPATARALELAGAAAHVIATDSKAEGALTAIIDYLGGDENVRGKRFLIPRAKVAREILPEGLRRLGARVDAVETYRTVKPDVERETVLRIFKENSIDVATFTSSSTISNFAAIVGLQDLSNLLANVLIACVGPVTAETAASHGLRNIIQPDLYNADALIESIVKAIGHTRESCDPG